MGTPEFAVPSLDILVQNGYDIAAVLTAPDKPGGRGKQLMQSAVKQYALAKNLPVLQPVNLKSPDFLSELKSLDADLQVVVAFRMLPEAVWAMPPKGTFNLHGSLLPQYRGAAPINWAVINGEQETGLTTFFLTREIDTGDVLFQEKIDIGENETAGELHDRMMTAGAQLVLKSVRAIESGAFKLAVQDDRFASHAPKIFHETCEINFNQSPAAVHNFVRGLSPYPAAWTSLQGKNIKVLRTLKGAGETRLPPGTFYAEGKKNLRIAVAGGFVEVLEIQPEGGKRMDAASFLNGYRSWMG
ncbi:MAG: methionyl-tRNA formyltransferase [Saprospiraceae bacterium]|nr:methionyl-tRNA formyltransferase [Saprospiraceae bacterium]